MRQLEIIDKDNWREFVGAEAAVLVLGRSDCVPCQHWTAELQAFVADDIAWTDVRFGKMELDQPGLADFKRINPWLAQQEDLPVTLVYVHGEERKRFEGGGIERLETRLRRLLRETPD